MKNYILTLLGTGMILAASAPAQAITVEPATYPGLAFHRVSPNGNWAVSYAYEVIQILDLQKGGDPYAITDMKVGVGNYVSNDGIVLASTATTDQTQYWKDGQWYDLTPDSKYPMCFANGITPDGSRMVGMVPPSDFEGYDGLMLVPCYWDLQPDGTYQGPNLITAPNRDPSGGKPQYVTAVYVSDDGKTVAGQLIEGRGDLAFPIVYKQGDDGTWTYDFLILDLFESDDISVPQSPGNGPVVTDYMSDDERTAYTRALNSWLLANANSEFPDYDSYPDPEDYMTPEELEEYNAALKTWGSDYNKFEREWLSYLSKVPNIGQNDLVMTSDGKTYVSSASYNNQTGPIVINLDTYEYEFLPQENNTIVTSIADNGTILGFASSWEVRQAYVIPPGQKKFIPLQDYVASLNPELGKWMEENLYHEVLFGAEWDMDMGTWIDHFFSGYATGMPFTNPDFSMIALAVEDDWNWQEDGVLTVGYIFSLDANGGIESLVSETPEGIYRVYNLQGVKILETKDSAALNDLPKGIYVINGKKVAIK